MKTKTEIIICPSCEKYQEAEAVLRDGDPFWSYVHVCECGRVVMESEWEAVDPIKELNELAVENARLREALTTTQHRLLGIASFLQQTKQIGEETP